MFLCQMSGLPGTGKSTLARHICKLTNAVLLDTDVVKSSILNSFENNIDFKFASKVAYETIFSLADSNLHIGNSVVIDSPCRYDIIIAQGTSIAQKYKVPYKFIECRLAIEHLQELNRRRVMREILPSQEVNIPINEEEYIKGMKSFVRPTNHEYLIVDTAHDIESYIGKVAEYLNLTKNHNNCKELTPQAPYNKF